MEEQKKIILQFKNFIKKYYKSNTQYEVHWSPEGPPPLVNWNPTSINNIFGTNLNANKEVFIRFELDSAVTSEVKKFNINSRKSTNNTFVGTHLIQFQLDIL